jgi:hypothetical protein
MVLDHDIGDPGLAEFGPEQRRELAELFRPAGDGRRLDDLLEQVALGLAARIGGRLRRGGGR